MAITFVGSVTGSGTGATITLDLTALTGGSGSTALEGDLVVVASGWVDASDVNPGVTTSGYTEVADLYANDSYDANLSVAYKLMGSTPDTSVVVSASNAGTLGSAAIAYVWRGVDPTTPLDVTSTTATGTATSRADAPSITPTTSGAVVLALMGAGQYDTSTHTGPSGMSGYVELVGNGSSADFAVAAAYYAWTSGAYDPPALTDGTTGAGLSWAAVTMALRPYVDIRVYYVIGPSSGWTDPDATEIKARQLDGGGTATASGNQTAPTSTTEPFTFSAAATGLTAGVSYKTACVWSDGTNNSNVAVSTAWSTTGGTTTYTMSAATYTGLTATGVTPRVTVTVAS